ncbi:MAG: hypothetical protein M3340_17160 [Actinomycetota bacterium]|nr:hypothetical protein [Actinomycetota bacterium]
MAGAAGAASVAGLGTLERALAAAGGGLTVARQQTFTALVEAVGLVESTGVHPGKAGRATADFERYYAELSPLGRQSIGVLLDAIESGPGGDGFGKMDPRARLKLLRRWTAGEGPRLTSDGLSWSAVASSAVNLAATPFHPHGAWDPPVAVAV